MDTNISTNPIWPSFEVDECTVDTNISTIPIWPSFEVECYKQSSFPRGHFILIFFNEVVTCSNMNIEANCQELQKSVPGDTKMSERHGTPDSSQTSLKSTSSDSSGLSSVK